MTDGTPQDHPMLDRLVNVVRIVGWSGAALALIYPAVAMQFSDDVNWTAFDFVFAAVLMGTIGGLFELTVRLARSFAYRASIGLALAAAFFLVWFSGAVGIIGGEDDPANTLFLGVIATALVGGAIARFRAPGMAHAMFAAAALQALIGLTAVLMGWGQGAEGPLWPMDVIGLTGFFTALWLGSAFLFRRAAQEKARAAT